MNSVTSQDSTQLAFERLGDDQPVIVVGRILCDRGLDPPAEELAKNFVVFKYGRQGCGDSGDNAPYAVERKIEDLAALIAEVGGQRPCMPSLPALASPHVATHAGDKTVQDSRSVSGMTWLD